MIDVIIPCKQIGEDIELRYCLRSIEKYLSGVGQIFLIGDKPAWLQNVIHIPATDEPGYKWSNKNLYEKTRIAIKDERLSEHFLYVHDDHFLLQQYEADKFPFYYSTQWEGTGPYRETIKNTKMLLGECVNFDVHCPILLNKFWFRALNALDWSKEWGYGIKTYYVHQLGQRVDFTKIADCKIREGNPRPQIAGRPWFSTDDRNLGQRMIELLQELYPEKSKYELCLL